MQAPAKTEGNKTSGAAGRRSGSARHSSMPTVSGLRAPPVARRLAPGAFHLAADLALAHAEQFVAFGAKKAERHTVASRPTQGRETFFIIRYTCPTCLKPRGCTPWGERETIHHTSGFAPVSR